MTGRELLTASLRLIGAVVPGESLSDAEATDGLAAINRMIASWSNEDLLIYTKTKDEKVLTANDGEYSFGTGGDINSARPLGIERATIKDTSSTPAIEHQLEIIPLSLWASIPDKELTSEIPRCLYASGSYPLETVYLYPVPSTAHTLVIYSIKPLTQISTLNTVLYFPEGYDEALIYNGAIRLAPEYGKQVPDDVRMIAMESKANLKRKNHRADFLKCDQGLLGKGSYDIYKGDIL